MRCPRRFERVQKNMQRQALQGLIKEEEIAPALARHPHHQKTLDDPQGSDLGDRAATETKHQEEDLPDLCTRIFPEKTVLATNTLVDTLDAACGLTDRGEEISLACIS